MKREKFSVIPLTLSEANELVTQMHRHHKKVIGHRFSLGAEQGGTLVGAAIIGRPVARKTDQRFVAEITRLVTDGSPNACSFLYGAAARVAREMGFRRIQTFILESEPGTSLKASGYQFDGMTTGGAWSGTPSRGQRQHAHPTERKARWVKDFT